MPPGNDETDPTPDADAAVAPRFLAQMVEGQGFDQGQRGAQKNDISAMATSIPARNR